MQKDNHELKRQEEVLNPRQKQNEEKIAKYYNYLCKQCKFEKSEDDLQGLMKCAKQMNHSLPDKVRLIISIKKTWYNWEKYLNREDYYKFCVKCLEGMFLRGCSVTSANKDLKAYVGNKGNLREGVKLPARLTTIITSSGNFEKR